METLKVTNLVTSVPSASTNYTFSDVYAKAVSIQVTWASTTAAFAFTIQQSNDGTNYVNYDTAQTIANDSGSILAADLTLGYAKYLRVALVKTSGTLTAFSVNVAYLPR